SAQGILRLAADAQFLSGREQFHSPWLNPNSVSRTPNYFANIQFDPTAGMETLAIPTAVGLKTPPCKGVP
ncbi:MAG TPA: hypothetical protein VFJ47_09945, partial [Terriglobales bacterium]|nr:hypothetical protein [Terriglobales bacterium]